VETLANAINTGKETKLLFIDNVIAHKEKPIESTND